MSIVIAGIGFSELKCTIISVNQEEKTNSEFLTESYKYN